MKKLPSLVIVGRPNVGKSTLFNRLTGTRRSIVTDEPGITRDRIYGKAEWRGRTLEVVDTGGIIPQGKGPSERKPSEKGADEKALIPAEIFRQARVAIDHAALLILVVDAKAGVTPLDEELARLLRGAGKPFFVAVNKVDAPSLEAHAADFHGLGAPVFAITAEHGTGVDDLLDAAIEKIDAGRHAPPPNKPDAEEERPGPLEVAIIGRPNVGKSTLLNRLVGEERSIVSPIPGTTMDTVDTEITRDGHAYRFVDTAGIRRKGKTVLVAEKLSVVMARRGLERCDVALLVVDGEQGVTQGDATIAMYAEQSGRSVIIVINKWDLAVDAMRKAVERQTPPGSTARLGSEAQTNRGRKKEARHGARVRGTHRDTMQIHASAPARGLDKGLLLLDYEKLVREKLKFLSYAPVVFLSAKSGERTNKIFPLIEQVAAARARRVATPELNRWLKEDVDLGRGTTPKARPVRIYYITQAKTAPPTFLLFTNQKQPLHFSYERFLENQLRGKFDFTGTPVRFVQRLRKRGERKSSE